MNQPDNQLEKAVILRVVSALLLAERQIALLERCRPLGIHAELERLVADWNRGRESSARFSYALQPDLNDLIRGLELIAGQTERFGDEGPWFGARAQELALDAELVQAVGTEQFAALAMRRFALPPPLMREAVDGCVEGFLRITFESSTAPLHRSNDRADERSLYSILFRQLQALGLKASILVEPQLPTVAATGIGSISIRPNDWLSELDARRIAAHEILGHLLPRENALKAHGILVCAPACASGDEEGRALYIEERLGLMDSARKHELGLRHRACALSREGAGFVEVVRVLRGLGASVRSAISVAVRCFRGSGTAGSRALGSGLGREIIYLPAYLAVRHAFEEIPELEGWFESGRCSLAYARHLGASLGEHAPPNAATFRHYLSAISTQTGT